MKFPVGAILKLTHIYPEYDGQLVKVIRISTKSYADYIVEPINVQFNTFTGTLEVGEYQLDYNSKLEKAMK